LASAAAFAEEHTAAIIAVAAMIAAPTDQSMAFSVRTLAEANAPRQWRIGLSGFFEKSLGENRNSCYSFCHDHSDRQSVRNDGAALRRVAARAHCHQNFYLVPPGEAKKEKRPGVGVTH
jgi:hypothetical protein